MRTKQENMKISKRSRIRTISLAMAGIFGILGFVGFGLSSINAFAEVFEAEQGLSFTLNSSVAVSITGGTGSGSDGLTIEDLVPGDYKDSNIITVTASSNSASGYTLSSSVGSSSSNYTDLRKTPSDSTNKFTNLSGNKASLSNFDPGTWGYSYSTNGGTSWISGDIVSGTSAGYNGLSLYTTTTPIKLINSSSASSSSIQFKIGAKATSSQVSGAYTNIINFIGVGKVITTNYAITFSDPSGEASGMPSQQTGTTDSGAVQLPSTVPTRTNYMFKGWCTIQVADGGECTGTGATQIQPSGFLALNAGTSPSNPEQRTLYAMWKDNSPTPPINPYCTDEATCMQTSTACDTTLTDGRDGATYTTATIGGACWMTQNLRFNGTELKVGESNVTSDITISQYYSLASADSSYTNHCDSTNGYNYPCIKTSTNTDYGTYYNYCAASAGEVCNNTTQQDATRSVCPAGWTLPTQAQLNAVPQKDSHFTASSGLAGYYYGGSLYGAGTGGYWWASTGYSATRQCRLSYGSGNDRWDVSYNFKYNGNSVRCVKSS